MLLVSIKRRKSLCVCSVLLVLLALSADSILVVASSLSRAKTRSPNANEVSPISQTAPQSSVPSVHLIRSLPGDDYRFDPGSNTMITTSGGSVKLWDIETGKLILTLDAATEITNAYFTSYGLLVVTSGRDKEQKNIVTRIWDRATGKLLAILAGYAVFVGSSSPVSAPTAITIHNRELKFWDATTGDLTKTVSAYTKVHSDWRFFLDSLISPDGKYIVPFSGKSLPLWNTDTGALIAELKALQDKELFRVFRGRTLEIDQAKFGPDGRTVATVDSYNRVEIWDASTGRLGSTLTGHLDSIYALEFSGDGRFLATASRDGTARVWDVSTGQLKHTFKAGKQTARRVEFSPNDTMLAVGYQNRARLWNMDSGQLMEELPEDKDISRMTLLGTYLHGIELSFSPDGKVLLTMSDKTVKVWDGRTGSFIATLEGARPPVHFSSNGKFFATSGPGKSGLLWEISSQ